MEPGIYIDTKPAPGGFFHGKNHLYIVYRDAAGNASVIRGGPESFASIPTGGDIAVEAGAPLAGYSPRAHPAFDNDLPTPCTAPAPPTRAAFALPSSRTAGRPSRDPGAANAIIKERINTPAELT